MGAGLAMAPGDIAFKSNFATLNRVTGERGCAVWVVCVGGGGGERSKPFKRGAGELTPSLHSHSTHTQASLRSGGQTGSLNTWAPLCVARSTVNESLGASE